MTGRYRRWDGGAMRTCSRCSEPRPLAEFRLDSKGYRRSHCIPCSLAVTREWRARHREALLARRRAAYAARRAEKTPGGEKREGAASGIGSCARVPTPGGTHTCDRGSRKTATSLLRPAASTEPTAPLHIHALTTEVPVDAP